MLVNIMGHEKCHRRQPLVFNVFLIIFCVFLLSFFFMLMGKMLKCQKDDFEQQTVCKPPVQWSKHTKPILPFFGAIMFFSSVIWIRRLDPARSFYFYKYETQKNNTVNYKLESTQSRGGLEYRLKKVVRKDVLLRTLKKNKKIKKESTQIQAEPNVTLLEHLLPIQLL